MLQISANVAGNAVKVRIFDSFSVVEATWKSFQDYAVGTPYQRYEWLEPWYRHVGAPSGLVPVLALGEANGMPAFLWPLALERSGGLKIFRWLGGKQNNYNFGLFDAEFLGGLGPEAIMSLLIAIADAAGGADLFDLRNQPKTWDGFDNPFFGFEAQTSPSPCYRLDLTPDFQSLEMARRSRRSAQGLNRKCRNLEAASG
ncbi:MAG: hypothetical protein AAGF59_16010, partial [Pseudomonadota bacterium]